jgi:hypothetical protein
MTSHEEIFGKRTENTLVPGALDKMRAAYKKRLDELKGK